jgi:hypothetical protein
MPCADMSIKALIMVSYVIGSVGLRSLLVLAMLCGGFELAMTRLPKKARKGRIIYGSME